MGFGTSGAVAIVLVGVLIAASVLVPTLFSIGSATGDAYAGQMDSIRDASNTDVAVETVERNETEGWLNVTAANDGTTTLDLAKTTVLIDGELVPLNETETTVTAATGGDGVSDTSYWPPDATLEVLVSEETLQSETSVDSVQSVERVVVITESGLSAGYTVSEGDQ